MKAFFHTILFQPFYNLFVLLVALIPGHNMGIAIIVLTVLVRIVLTPLKHNMIESQAKQRELQPEINKIKEKYKDDKTAESTATLQLYKDKGINPASGCLPMLIQFPILIVLYYVFRAGLGPENNHVLYSFVKPVETVNTSFLWLQDITKVDPTFILPILAGVSQFFYSRSMMSTMTPTGDSSTDMMNVMSKQMMYLFPVMTILIARSLPAALSVYWVVATLVDWYQQVQGMKKVKAKMDTEGKVAVTVRKKKTDKDAS